MKKKVVSAILVAAMTASMFAGCGSDDGAANNNSQATNNSQAAADTDTDSKDNSAANTEAAGDDVQQAPASAVDNLIKNTTGTVTLDVWCSETEAYQNAMKEIVENFKAEYSDVTFDIKIGGVSEADAKDRVLEDVEAAADVFVFADDQINELVKAGALQSVDATYTYNPTEANGESIVQAASVDGKLYAYPLTASNGYFLYYNSQYFSEADVASWEGILAKAAEAGKKVGMDIGNGWYNYGFFAGAGLEAKLADDGVTNICNWNSTDNKPTGAEVAESIMNICKNPSFIAIGGADATAMLPQGDLIAYVSGTWDVPTVQAAYGDGYAAAKLPTFNAGGQDVQMASFAGYKFVGVNAFSDNIGWSMLLSEYITNEANQAKIAEATGEGPSNINAASTISSPALAALAAQAEFADLQRIGGAYWDPAASLGSSLIEGTDDLQGLLDTAVAGITQAQ